MSLTLSLLGEINTRINSSENLPELLYVIMDSAKRLCKAEASSLLLIDQESGDLVFDVAVGDKASEVERQIVPMGEGFAGHVAQTCKPLIVNDVENDPRHYKEIDKMLSKQTHNIIVVPMKVKNDLVGVLEVINSIDRTLFTNQDMRLLSYLADQAAIAINNRELMTNLENRLRELSCLYEMSQHISFIHDEEILFQTALEKIADVMQVERASFLFRNDTEQGLRIRAAIGIDMEAINDILIDPDKGISGHVLRTGDPLLVRNIDQENSFKSSIKGDYKTKSFLSVPLHFQESIIGVLNVADKKTEEPFDWFDLRILSTIASQITEAFSNLRLERQLIQSHELKKELSIAASIQHRTLTDPFYKKPGFVAAASICMARAVGGDFFSLQQEDEDRHGVLIADVSGKGIPAALFVSSLRNTYLSLTGKKSLPRDILRRLNEVMYRDSEAGMFATCCYLICDTSSRLILVANAGHLPALLIKQDGSIQEINPSGRPLGIAEDSVYTETAVIYDDGDLLFLYTDGISEERIAEDGSEFGEERLKEFLIENRNLQPEELNTRLLNHILDLTGHHPEEDDQTCISIRLGDQA